MRLPSHSYAVQAAYMSLRKTDTAFHDMGRTTVDYPISCVHSRPVYGAATAEGSQTVLPETRHLCHAIHPLRPISLPARSSRRTWPWARLGLLDLLGPEEDRWEGRQVAQGPGEEWGRLAEPDPGFLDQVRPGD